MAAALPGWADAGITLSFSKVASGMATNWANGAGEGGGHLDVGRSH